MTPEEFDFESAREEWPDHWDERGWPAFKSTWRSRNYPQMRVRVTRVVDEDRVQPRSQDHLEVTPGESFTGDVHTHVMWDGSLDELRGLFTYESTERWNIDSSGFVYGSAGIDRDGRWRDEGSALEVIFDRAMFGGPDTWHLNFEDRTPFFEPIPDWEY